MAEKRLTIAMLGHKHVLSREGGIEIVVRELATRMTAKGHRVICYDRSTAHVSGVEVANVTDYEGIKIIPVWTIEKKGFAAITSSISAAWQASKSEAEVVHIHAEGPAAMCWIPKLKGKKVIVTVHGLDWARAKWGRFAKKYIRLGERQAVKYADEIIVLSHNLQDYFKTTYGRETIFIPNGITKPIIQSAKEIKEKWDLEKDQYVLFLGRVVPEKGLRYLIEAWKNLRTDKKLVIAGGSSDTDEFVAELKSVATENVIFTGFQQGRILEELYSNAYIYVLPSDLEGMPLSLLEAMSYGNCCLVSDIPECIEVVEDKAVTFKHSNTKDLERVLQKLLDSPELVCRYKSISSEYICHKYNWDDVVEKTLQLYTKDNRK